METVPRSRCFSLWWKVAGKDFLEGSARRPQTEEPPSEALDVGPSGSPVWKEKLGWTE
jgi:hypothetical protein